MLFACAPSSNCPSVLHAVLCMARCAAPAGGAGTTGGPPAAALTVEGKPGELLGQRCMPYAPAAEGAGRPSRYAEFMRRGALPLLHYHQIKASQRGGERGGDRREELID